MHAGTVTTPDWYPDPLGRFEVRYHDSVQWTEHVATAGQASIDPMPTPQDFAAAQQPAPPPGLASMPNQAGGPSPTGSSGGNNRGLVAILIGVGVVGALVVAGIVLLLSGGDGDGEVVAGSTATSSTDGSGEASSTTTAASTSSQSTTTTQLTTTIAPTTAQTEADVPPGSDASVEIPEYGSNSELDALADACQRGEFEACDALYLASELGSGYETYGDTCGGRNDPAGFCTLLY